MRLFEYESKKILRDNGISCPNGVTIGSTDGISILDRVEMPCFVKAQLPIGGRGKGGGIVKALTITEAYEKSRDLLSQTINGYPVEKILVEESIGHKDEYYISISIDRRSASYILIAGSIGGMDIESIAKERPESILKIALSPLRTIRSFDALLVSRHMGIDSKMLLPFLHSMLNTMISLDAELVEINPLVITQGKLMALDAKIQIDDYALFRQPSISGLPPRGFSKEEEAAKSLGLNYVSLNGNIGIIGNGAGLTMATMDLIKSKGGSPGNFLDVGGGALSESFRRAIAFLNSSERVQIIFVNIFGGITRCDEVAKGVSKAISEEGLVKPIIVRLVGTNSDEGRQILQLSGIPTYTDPEEAAEKAVKMAGG